MSLDLYQDETRDRLADLRPVSAPDSSMFDGFVRGTASFAMRGLAKTGRAIDMAGAVGPIVQDAISGGTEAQDRYFKEHDQVFGSAVDYWTPKPNEVGVAAEIAGTLIGQLPLILASPHLAVGAQVLDTAEDLVKQGVEAKKAVATGVVQGAGLATGIWMPILGKNLWQRAFIGGAGFNVAQGIVTRAASEMILEGSPAAKAFETFDLKSLTLDALMGMAFGSLAHLSPASREHGAKVVAKIMDWMQERSPSEVGAITTLRTAQHLNEDSAPGRPVEAADIEAHANRVRAAVDQLAKDEPVEVSDLPAPNAKPDSARFTAAARRAEQLQAEGEKLAKAYDLVLEEPTGPVNDPLVRMMPEDIGDIFIQRGEAVMKDGELVVKKSRHGLVKVIWKHGEKSKTPAEFQVTKEDVLRLPEIVRDYVPVVDVTKPTGERLLEWQVERADGKKVIYGTRKFTNTDQRQQVVTIMVNEETNDAMKTKGISEKTNRQSDSSTAGAMPGVRDTGPQPLLSSAGGQKGGSKANLSQADQEKIANLAASGRLAREAGNEALALQADDEIKLIKGTKTEGPAGQPRGAEPPPPRGPSEETPAGQSASPLELEGQRIAAEQPDLRIVVGHDADGEPIVKSAKDFLADADAQLKNVEEEASLIRAAATCLLGIA